MMKQHDAHMTAYALGELEASELAGWQEAMDDTDEELGTELIAIGSLARMLEGAYAQQDELAIAPVSSGDRSRFAARRIWISLAGAAAVVALILSVLYWTSSASTQSLPEQAGAGATDSTDSHTPDAAPKPRPTMRYAE